MEAPLFTPVFDRVIAALQSDATRLRDCGEVRIDVRALRPGTTTGGVHAGPVLDAFVEAIDWKGPGSWTEIDPDEARALLERLVGRDLAYNARTMSEEAGARLAARFVAHFPKPSRFFTNTDLPDDIDDIDGTWSGAWRSITEATFDGGVVALTEDRLGIFWVKDEH